jgi:hypothetical protein
MLEQLSITASMYCDIVSIDFRSDLQRGWSGSGLLPIVGLIMIFTSSAAATQRSLAK